MKDYINFFYLFRSVYLTTNLLQLLQVFLDIHHCVCLFIYLFRFSTLLCIKKTKNFGLKNNFWVVQLILACNVSKQRNWKLLVILHSHKKGIRSNFHSLRRKGSKIEFTPFLVIYENKYFGFFSCFVKSKMYLAQFWA